jgi:protocatechuate 3,4-dioxygenase beta subunit
MRLLGSRAFQPRVPRAARRRADDLARELALIRNIPRPAKDGAVVYRFDIRLQGEGETVFFDV